MRAISPIPTDIQKLFQYTSQIYRKTCPYTLQVSGYIIRQASETYQKDFQYTSQIIQKRFPYTSQIVQKRFPIYLTDHSKTISHILHRSFKTIFHIPHRSFHNDFPYTTQACQFPIHLADLSAISHMSHVSLVRNVFPNTHKPQV